MTRAALGALAIRLGDSAEAERMDQWLARRPARGAESIARARMALLRGDRDAAIRLLRRAYDEGQRNPNHTDPDLEPLVVTRHTRSSTGLKAEPTHRRDVPRRMPLRVSSLRS